VHTDARNSAPKDYSLFRHFIAFAGSPHIAVHSGIRQYTSVTITHKAETPEQHGTTKLHPIQRPEFPAKGKNLHATPMHTKANSLNALSFSVLLTLLTLLCPSQALFAQAPLKDRVVQAVDSSQVTAVKGNVHPMARPEFDQGRVDPSMPMRVTMTFKMTAAQQADLDALLAAQQQRGSPDYQRWLTPEQFGSRFGLSQGDINKVTGWLESEGFHVEGVPASRNMITFSGTAQQVESALHTEMHRYVVNGKAHFANASEPSVPAALSDVVLGFRSLDNFQLKPRTLKMNPRFTSSLSRNHFVAPPDFATIYDVVPLYQQRGITGTGQKIVIVGQSNININDVRAFRSNSGLSANDPQIMIVPFETDPGIVSSDIDEASLDVEWGGAIAPNATVIFVIGNAQTAGGVFDAIRHAITANLAPVISTSYGDCEANFAPSDISFLQSLMQQANSQGITVLGPAGDTGPADCDFNNNPNTPVTASTQGLAVDLPGALQSVTSVGGTEFNEGTGVYWKTAVTTDVVSSALRYIPETAWNDTDVTLELTAGGGGSSTVIRKPAWQAGTGVPNDGARDVPDISFSASPIHDAYLICSEDFNSTTKTFSPTCVNGFRRNDLQMTLTAVGGTSVGPPVMAGIVALINQLTNRCQPVVVTGCGLGNINPVLYPLAARLPSAFHDVQGGDNKVPFSPPCGASAKIGYNALPGYDLATGLGSIDAFVLVTNWTTVTPASTANAVTSVDFSLASAPTQLTVKRGSCGSGTLVVTRLNGFVGTPSFTCTVPATLGSTTTCAVVPAITVAFTPPGSYRELGWWGVAGVLLGGVAFVLASFARPGASDTESRAWPRLVPGFVVVSLLAIMIGCSGSSNTSGSAVVSYPFAIQVPSTAPVASGAVTVNAAIGGINHTAQITVTTQ
jgi:subtilase family serine protease